jgi:hypothetical protein
MNAAAASIRAKLSSAPSSTERVLAVLAAFHPRPLWVIEMVEPLLVFMVLAVVDKVPGCSRATPINAGSQPSDVR